MPRISICSDVHIEFGQAIITNTENADVLVLAGDVCIAEDLKRHPEDQDNLNKRTPDRLRSAMHYREFFRECARQFKHVIYIMGNHEHYDGEFDTSFGIVKDAVAKIAPNIHVMEDETITIDGVLFVCATMWTDMNKGDSLTAWHCSQNMTDYRIVRIAKDGYRKLRPADTVNVHRKSAQFFKIALENNRAGANLPVVCVTHHAPSSSSVSICYRGNLLNGAYYSDLSDMILDNPEIKYWFHGHTHAPFDYMIGDTRVICNPRGYYGEQTAERELTLVTVDL